MKSTYRSGIAPVTSVAATLATMLLSSSALAQTTSTETAGSGGTLGEIIVTAQRRSEPLQDVPITINTVSAEKLAADNVTTVQDLQYEVPGFRLDENDGLFQPTIRGISTSYGCTGCGTDVGVYLDGFYDPHGLGLNLDLFNIKNVEVLKGPQGTLFGRNTVGGAVLINTVEPSTQTSGFLQASYGSYNAQKYEGYFTTGLTDKVALSVGGLITRGDGYVTDVLTNNNKYGQYESGVFRTGLKITVTDYLSFLLRYEHDSLNDPNGLMFDAFLLNGKPLAYGDYLPGAVVAAQRGEVATPFQVSQPSSLNSYQLTGTLDLGLATLKSYTQYRQDMSTNNGNYALSSVDLLHLQLPNPTKTITQELVLSSNPGGPLQWVGGVYYYDSTDSYHNILEAVGGAPYSLLGTTFSTDKSYAVYGNVTYRILEHLFLTGGLRYTWDYIENTGWTLPATGTTILPTLQGTKATPRVVLRYQVNDQSSAYVSYAQGYKAGLYNTGAFSSVPIKPEDLTAYEVGYKHAAPRLSYDLSVFYNNYTNEQLASDIFVNGADESEISNAGDSHIYGVDADMRFQVFRNFQLSVAGEYLHARYTSFPNAPAFTVAPTHLLLTTIVNAAGDEMPRSPPFTANVSGTYNTALGNGMLALSANFYYTTNFYWDYANQLPQKSYETLGLRAAWTDSSGRYELAVSGNNVTNAKYYTAENQDIFEAGGIWAPPPTIEGSIRVNFR